MKTFEKNPALNARMENSGYDPLAKFFGNDFLKSCNGDNPATVPAIYIKEKKDVYRIEMAIPGFNKKD